jgi:hypothetical protein
MNNFKYIFITVGFSAFVFSAICDASGVETFPQKFAFYTAISCLFSALFFDEWNKKDQKVNEYLLDDRFRDVYDSIDRTERKIDDNYDDLDSKIYSRINDVTLSLDQVERNLHERIEDVANPRKNNK